MAEDFNAQIKRIQAKATVVAEKYLTLKTAFEKLHKENNQLKAELLVRDKEIEQLRMKVEHLSIASTVKAGSEDLEATKAMVAEMVREIDQCIIDLSE